MGRGWASLAAKCPAKQAGQGAEGQKCLGGCCPKGPLNQRHGTAGENTTNSYGCWLSARHLTTISEVATGITPASDKAIRVRCLPGNYTANKMQSQDLTPALPDTKPNAFPPKPSRV